MAADVTITDNAANSITFSCQDIDVDCDRKLKATPIKWDRSLGYFPPDPAIIDLMFQHKVITIRVTFSSVAAFLAAARQMEELSWLNPPTDLAIGSRTYDDVVMVDFRADSDQERGGDSHITGVIQFLQVTVF